jgi:HTH-type transcriptional regulator, transcriptional repressor of NAD biosynthesis genes
MKSGLVFGKFMPLHKGHLALIHFACSRCETVTVVVCYTDGEPVPGGIREYWLRKELEKYPRITLISFRYDESELPNTSESSREVSGLWANELRRIVPDADILFTSEPYGDYVAEFMQIQHVSFDKKRITHAVSGTVIRAHPLQYWDEIADAAKPYFVKTIALVGTESTGKTTLTQKLAAHYNTAFVPEMAREVIEKTETCTYDDLLKIAILHASTILKKIQEANKLFFIDTDLTITRSYAEFLFNKTLTVPSWIEEANNFDLHLFLEPDCDYVQDGTRLSQDDRLHLSDYHKKALARAGISFVSINGGWEERFQKAKQVIEQRFF